VIGPLGIIGSDISFDTEARLHVWVPAVRQVGVIDLTSGAVKLLGTAGAPGSTGGLSIDDRGQILVAAAGSTPRLDAFDSAKGELQHGPPLVNAPYGAFNSLTISSRGVLYAVNSNMGAPASTRLVTIDRKTGEVTNLGALPPDTDALAFLPAGSSAAAPDFNWKPILIALAVIVTLVTLVFTVVRPRPR
jgi:sugar lactone lactonase YvrE